MSVFPPVVYMSGPFGYALVLLGFVVLSLSGRALWTFTRGGGASDPTLREQTNSVLFWGIAAGVFGFLGQCQGTYLALNEILAASAVHPQIVAQGFVISFFPTLLGFGIMAYAVVAWASLRLLPRGAGPVLPLFFLALLFFACQGAEAQRPEQVTEGVWEFEAGPNLFLWEFTPDPSGSADSLGITPLHCLVHDFLEGLKYTETPCSQASLDGNALALAMPNGVRYEGTVALAQGTIEGRLLYVDGTDMEASFHWAPRSDYPALQPRSGDENPYVYQPPEERTDGWRVDEASAVGVDPSALERTVASVARGDAGVLKSLLVARGGRLVLEEYFHGFEARDPTPILSCTKSISSLLVGLAIQEGYIEGVDAPLLDFFPEVREKAGSGWEDLTLEHLLTMSLALDWSPEEEEGLHGTGPEAFSRILARGVAGRPGEDWAYVSMNVNLLAGVLKQATGEHAEAFAARTLFGPLGITDWNWDYARTDGFNLMDGSLQLRPRDMAKIGVMVLNGGEWNGSRIVEESWIQESVTQRLSAGPTEGYGYLWWTMELPGPSGEKLQIVFANGWGSQFILLFPPLELVVVTTGGNQDNGKHLAIGEVLIRDLLPGVSLAPTQ